MSPLQRDESIAFFMEFIDRCVKGDFRKKMMNSFDSERPITSRFFNRAAEIEATERLQKLFRMAANNVNATVLWGPLSHPIAFKLSGRSDRLSDVFVTDSDSIARLSIGDSTRFFFFDGTREISYVCDEDGRQKKIN